MPYTPGDNWTICDLTGKKVLMSQTRKTWDGLRVWDRVWYPKHPQLSIKAIPDRMAVPDARSRPADTYYTLTFAWGAFCLISPNGTYYTFAVDDDGALLPYTEKWGMPQPSLVIAGHVFTVDDDGALHVRDQKVIRPDPPWSMISPDGTEFELTVADDHAVIITEV